MAPITVDQSEVADLEQAIGQIEAQEGAADGDAGLGDLLDDFVLQATDVRRSWERQLTDRA